MAFWIVTIGIILGAVLLVKLALVASIVVVLPFTHGAMFHPSARIRVKTFLDNIPMRKGSLLIDIGCGDGRVLREAHRRYGVRAVGFEINPLAYVLARIRTLGLRGVSVKMQNFWKVNLSEADVIFCYLFPDIMEKLASKLKSELRPGTPVISCNFPFPDWPYSAVLYPDSSLNGDPIYVYKILG
jgi:ribosomal protein L11 methylase PrmA